MAQAIGREGRRRILLGAGMCGELGVVGQAVRAAVLAAADAGLSVATQVKLVAAAAHGAAQGLAAGPSAHDEDALLQEEAALHPAARLEEALVLVGDLTGRGSKCSIGEAKTALREKGALGEALAARLSKLSKCRNAAVHPDVTLLAEMRALFEGVAGAVVEVPPLAGRGLCEPTRAGKLDEEQAGGQLRAQSVATQDGTDSSGQLDLLVSAVHSVTGELSKLSAAILTKSDCLSSVTVGCGPREPTDVSTESACASLSDSGKRSDMSVGAGDSLMRDGKTRCNAQHVRHHPQVPSVLNGKMLKELRCCKCDVGLSCSARAKLLRTPMKQIEAAVSLLFEAGDVYETTDDCYAATSMCGSAYS